MNRILLIEPRAPQFNIFTAFKMPRLGLAILGTLADRAGYEVKIIYQESTPVRREHILWADLIGFSITTSTAPEGYRLARIVRALDRCRKTPAVIVFGGVHATFAAEEALEVADYVLRGEADRTFVDFLAALARGQRPEVPGASWREPTGFRHIPIDPRPVSLDEVPTPKWSLFEGYRPRVGAVMTSRGCPYDCSFCSVTAMLGRRYRMRSLDLVMRDLAEVGTQQVFFYDDNFAAAPERTKELLRRIIAARGAIAPRRFSAQVRVEVARDPELLDLMKQAGFTTLFIGFESVSPETLSLYNKRQSLSDIEAAVREIHAHAMAVHGMFVFGSDADTEETFRETVRFARRTRIETVQFLILTPLPGTRLHNEFAREGRLLNADWSRYDAFNAVFLPRRMSPYRLQAATLQAMARFYSPASALRWLLRGKPYVAALHAYGRTTLELWKWRNRGALEQLRRDHRVLFRASEALALPALSSPPTA